MIAGGALAYSYFELSSPLTLCTAMAPITLALGLLMISRVPYPSFKTIDVHRRAPIELMMGVLMVAACVFAMPQVSAFVLAASYVLSGPILMVRGERMQPKIPVLRPVPSIHANKDALAAGGKRTKTSSDRELHEV